MLYGRKGALALLVVGLCVLWVFWCVEQAPPAPMMDDHIYLGDGWSDRVATKQLAFRAGMRESRRARDPGVSLVAQASEWLAPAVRYCWGIPPPPPPPQTLQERVAVFFRRKVERLCFRLCWALPRVLVLWALWRLSLWIAGVLIDLAAHARHDFRPFAAAAFVTVLPLVVADWVRSCLEVATPWIVVVYMLWGVLQAVVYVLFRFAERAQAPAMVSFVVGRPAPVRFAIGRVAAAA